MRTQGIIAIATTIITILLAPSAFAECSNTIYGKVATGYILKDVGVTASDQPVAQGGYTRTCGKLSSDIFLSTGPQQKTAHEVDFSGFYDDQYGPVKIQLSGQYYFVNLGHSLTKPKDDIAEFYADASVPISLAGVTISPLIRVVQIVGVKTLPSETLLQGGGRISVQLNERTSFNAEIRKSRSSRHYSVWRSSATLSNKISKSTSINVGWENTDRTDSVFSIGASRSF
ncbi:MAG: hypothetical protein AB203_03690 [Parcubacteria bacterium C7867-008]|nr:MAG: hypothetical protein AB203_03690 [Parcubacteria bacterium C7867-008]